MRIGYRPGNYRSFFGSLLNDLPDVKRRFDPYKDDLDPQGVLQKRRASSRSPS